MVTGYFVASVFMVGVGAAAVEIPGNIFQNIAGVLGGMALTVAVRKAYPPVIKFRW
jgi:trimethylamine:corrinoid methyltransferase-like protein